MIWILLLSLLLLTWLLLASRTGVWWKAGLMSLLLLTLSAWWLINKLSGDGLNAATLYHLGADMEGAGVADFKGYIAGFLALALLSLLPLAALGEIVGYRRVYRVGMTLFTAASLGCAEIMLKSVRLYSAPSHGFVSPFHPPEGSGTSGKSVPVSRAINSSCGSGSAVSAGCPRCRKPLRSRNSKTSAGRVCADTSTSCSNRAGEIR